MPPCSCLALTYTPVAASSLESKYYYLNLKWCNGQSMSEYVNTKESLKHTVFYQITWKMLLSATEFYLFKKFLMIFSHYRWLTVFPQFSTVQQVDPVTHTCKEVHSIHCCITSFPKIQWFKTTVHIISDSFWGLWIWVAQLGLSGLGCLIRLQSDVACSVSRWGLTGARRQTSKVAHVGSSPQGLSTVCVSSQQGSWLPSEWATWETIIDIGMPFLTRPWQSLIIMSAMLYWTPRPALIQCRKEITQGWDARRWGSWGAGGRLATTPKSTLR